MGRLTNLQHHLVVAVLVGFNFVANLFFLFIHFVCLQLAHYQQQNIKQHLVKVMTTTQCGLQGIKKAMWHKNKQTFPSYAALHMHCALCTVNFMPAMVPKAKPLLVTKDRDGHL